MEMMPRALVIARALAAARDDTHDVMHDHAYDKDNSYNDGPLRHGEANERWQVSPYARNPRIGAATEELLACVRIRTREHGEYKRDNAWHEQPQASEVSKPCSPSRFLPRYSLARLLHDPIIANRGDDISHHPKGPRICAKSHVRKLRLCETNSAVTNEIFDCVRRKT